jgi:hypothetical protein
VKRVDAPGIWPKESFNRHATRVGVLMRKSAQSSSKGPINILQSCLIVGTMLDNAQPQLEVQPKLVLKLLIAPLQDV